jgi:hypothetical protein
MKVPLSSHSTISMQHSASVLVIDNNSVPIETMKRQLGLKRSFNCEDLASIVHESMTTGHSSCNDSFHKRSAKRLRRQSPCNAITDDASTHSPRHSFGHGRFISPTTSQDRVAVTPDASPSIPSMSCSKFSLSNELECPATAALNRALLGHSSSSVDCSGVFPFDEEKVDDDASWPSFERYETTSPRAVDQFFSRPRRISNARRCSLREEKSDDAEVGKLQTAFSLLSFPQYKLKPRSLSSLVP